MSDVTQLDREAAANLFGGTEWSRSQFISGKRDKTDKVQAFAAHRIAGEKAVLDRLRDLPDDGPIAIYYAVTSQGADISTGDVRTIASALADALETKR